MLPLHVLANVGQPGEGITATLTWQDGTKLEYGNLSALRNSDGKGIVVANVDWQMESQPPNPATQPATLELRGKSGAVLASQQVTVVSPSDPDTREVTLYWILGGKLQAAKTRIVKTQAIGTATLEELIWGPTPRNLAGFETAIPTPEQVLSYAGREADWGPRVTLRKLTIVDGVATVDFSREMRAYATEPLRVQLLRDQISSTLRQFSTVKDVFITIEGRADGVLEP